MQRFTRILAFILLISVASCIQPYIPNLKNYKSILVVEGLFTNENSSCKIKLSRTFTRLDSVREMVADANVFITDSEGIKVNLQNFGNGFYKTDSTLFRGDIGKKYTLHIFLSNNEEYISSPCTMFPVPDIDTVYYAVDEQFINNQTVTKKGVSIYLDSKPESTDNHFLRWEYIETWKFRVPYPLSFIYIDQNNIIPIPDAEIKEFCWKSSRSSEVLLKDLTTDRVRKEPLKFIVPDESDRLSLRYSILVKQYSISQSDYIFWNKLNKSNEELGDIFGSQPPETLSNIRNVNNPDEKVLGYFQVSAANEKRIYINYSDVYPLNLPMFDDKCPGWELDPSYLGPNIVGQEPHTFDDLYLTYLKAPGMIFVRPKKNPLTDELVKLIYTSIPCSNCELSGSLVRPAFWTDN